MCACSASRRRPAGRLAYACESSNAGFSSGNRRRVGVSAVGGLSRQRPRRGLRHGLRLSHPRRGRRLTRPPPRDRFPQHRLRSSPRFVSAAITALRPGGHALFSPAWDLGETEVPEPALESPDSFHSSLRDEASLPTFCGCKRRHRGLGPRRVSRRSCARFQGHRALRHCLSTH